MSSKSARQRRGSRAASVPGLSSRGAFYEALESRRLLTAAPIGIALDTHFGTAGTALTTLVPGAYVDSWAVDATVAPDGKLLVTGYQQFANVNARRDAVVERYDGVTGAPDPTFGQAGTARLHRDGYDLVAQQAFVQSDGKVLAVINASYWINASYYTTGLLARFNADGTLDRSYGNGGTVDINSRSGIDALPMPGGKLLVSGATTGPSSGNAVAALWRYNADGSLDTTFGGGGMQTYTQNGYAIQSIGTLTPLPDGSFVAITDFGLTRYDADGSVRWAQPPVLGSRLPTSIAATPDGNIVGVMPNYGSSSDINVQRYNAADGSLDATFGNGGVAQMDLPNLSVTLSNIAVQADGKVLLGGSTGSGISQRYAIVRLTANGQLDANFNNGGLRVDDMAKQIDGGGELHSFALSPDGRALYATGVTTLPAPGTPANAGTRYNFATVRYALDPAITVDANGPATPVDEGTTFPVSAAGSSYANGTIDLYEWSADTSFPDGTAAVTGVTAQLLAANGPGAHPEVRVTTSDGLQAIAPVNVTEANVPPVITLPGGSGPYLAAQNVSFPFAAIVNDAGGDAATVTIDWGDGSAPFSGSVSYIYRYLGPSHTYSARGTYTIKVDATDADGGVAQEVTTTVNVVQGVGTVFNDVNDDGFLTANDTGIAGAIVYLDANNNGQLDAGETQTTADATGHYGFDGLPYGTDNVRVVPPAGYHPSRPRTGPAVVTVSSTTGFSTDLGVTTQADVTGIVFRDDNGNGVRNASETQPVQATVYADVNNNGKLDVGEPNASIMTTQAYALTNLPAGTYSVRLSSVTGGYLLTTPVGGAIPVTVAAGQTLAVPDIGFQPATASIGGVVYNDTDQSGTPTTGEAGVAGVTVYADANNNGSLDAGERRAVTDASGNYSLYGFIAGTYAVRAIPPAGWAQSAPAGGAAITRTLTAGQTSSGANFGLYATSAVPGVPTNVSAVALDRWHIRVSWSPASSGAAPDGYLVYRRLSGSGTYALIATVGPDVTSFDDNSPKLPGYTYQYLIHAYQGAYDSGPSASQTAQLPALLFSASAPNNLYIRRNSTDPTVADFWFNSATPGQGTPDGQQPVSQTSSFGYTLTGGSGDDTVTLDYSNGYPGISVVFDGGTGGLDVFRIIGSSGDDTLIAEPGGYLQFSNASVNEQSQVKNVQLISFPGGSGGNDTLNVRSGNWTIDASTPAGATPNVSVTVQDLSSATFLVDQRLAGLSIHGGSVSLAASASTLSLAGPLTITRGSTLDLGAGEFLVDPTTTPLATLRAYLQAGYDGGKWDGVGGITSSAVRANAQHYALGYALAGEPNVTAGSPPGTLLVRPTMFGDANLDGTVTNADISNMIAGGHYLDGSANNTWAAGDWNYDGKVDNYDVSNLIASGNYLSGQTYTAPSAPAAATIDVAPVSPTVAASAPEPAAVISTSSVSTVHHRARHHHVARAARVRPRGAHRAR